MSDGYRDNYLWKYEKLRPVLDVKAVKRRRLQLGLSIYDMAERMDIQPQNYWQIEHNYKPRLSLPTYHRLVVALDYPPPRLIRIPRGNLRPPPLRALYPTQVRRGSCPESSSDKDPKHSE